MHRYWGNPIRKLSLSWYCQYCIIGFPFSSVNNKVLHSLALSSGPTNINNHASPTVKKNKKKKKFPKIFWEINQIFDQSDNLISCDYYGIPEFEKMKMRWQEGLSILLLNFSFISSHINDLRNFLSLVRQKFNMICISESRISTKNPKTTNRDFPGENIEQTLLNPLLEEL